MISLKVVVTPVHIVVAPLIGAAIGLLSIVVIAVHPTLGVYVTVAMPAETPVTIPELEPIVAISALLIDQTPPAATSVKLVVELTHTLVTPNIPPDVGLIVTLALPSAPQQPLVESALK